ncbi:MAG: cold shock domain-containing protein [Candidatus Gracilibacteria bacterium]|jgi:CspA family cold shock protein
MKGIIKKLNERGFGFISMEGQKDIFFHANDCPNGDFKGMKEGQAVTFETASSDKGPKAVNVVVDNGAGAAQEEASADEAPEAEEAA